MVKKNEKSYTTTVKVMGIDLAGLEKNITGICVLVLNHEPILYSVHRDEEIIRKVEEEKPAVVAIDAPLSFYGEPSFQGLRPRNEKILFNSAFDFQGNAAAHRAGHEIGGDCQREEC